VTVGDVMDELANRPTAGTIRRVELLVTESVDGSAESVWNCGDALDVTGAVGLRVGASPFEFSDGVREVQYRRSAHGFRDDGVGEGVAGKEKITTKDTKDTKGMT